MSNSEVATSLETPTKENKQEQEKPSVKRNREDKLRKKDDKSVDHVLKALSSLESTEEKLGAMCQKYAEMFNDHRILQNAAKVAEKKNCILQKEKEQLQAEHSKAILTRSRLENLCRELQRQNKAVKEECMLKIREEEEKKREVAAKFQSTLTELGNLLAQNNDKNAKLRDDNLDMTTKLKSVCEQYEKKEQHVEKMAKQMHLEMQLANTKLAKAKMEMALEKEGLLRDNQQLLLELKEYKKQLEEMKTSEVALRSQIQLYNDKYDEFHKALLQSNDAIGSFKQEMERMAKQIRKLEKETVAWKRRYETTHRTLLQMTEEKIKSDQTASVSERKLTALQGVCRSLQAQCNHLREVVKAQAAATGTSPPDVPAANAVPSVQQLEKICDVQNQDENLVKNQNDTVVTEKEQTDDIQRSSADETTMKTETSTVESQKEQTVEVDETSAAVIQEEQTAEIQISSDETLLKTETSAAESQKEKTETFAIATQEEKTAEIHTSSAETVALKADTADSAIHKEQIKEIETSLDEIDKTLADIQNESENQNEVESVNADESGNCNHLPVNDSNQDMITVVDTTEKKFTENSCNEIVLEKDKNSDDRLSVSNINGCANNKNLNEADKKLIIENSVVLNITSPLTLEETLTNGNDAKEEQRLCNNIVNSSAVDEEQNTTTQSAAAAVCSNNNGGLQNEKSAATATPRQPTNQNNQTQGKKSKNKRKKSGGTATK